MTPKQEARLYGRAIRKRWDVPDEMKTDVVNALHEIATTGEKESARVAACSALMSAELQNQRDEHKVIDIGLATRHDQISAIALDLGIDPALILDGSAETDRGS